MFLVGLLKAQDVVWDCDKPVCNINFTVWSVAVYSTLFQFWKQRSYVLTLVLFPKLASYSHKTSCTSVFTERKKKVILKLFTLWK